MGVAIFGAPIYCFLLLYHTAYYISELNETVIPMKEKILLILLLLISISHSVIAQGDLLIFPKRIAFEGIQIKTQNINLTNIGKDTATYKLSYNQIKMDEDGKFIPIEEPELNQRFASPYLRFYPRIVTLAPHESQTVKIQLIRTDELQQGEYRSHLYFRSVPKNSVLGEGDPVHKSAGLSINLTPVYGISIANIITIGATESAVQLTNMLFSKSQDGTPTLSLDFNRSGIGSCYGDIQVNYLSPEGTISSVATIKGFAIYTPGNLRRAKIKLRTDPKTTYSKGQLQVIFSTQEPGLKYAEASLQL